MTKKLEQLGISEDIDSKKTETDRELDQEQEQIKARQKAEIRNMNLGLEDQRKVEEFLEKKYKENAQEAQKLIEEKIKLWRPARESRNDVYSMAKEGTKAHK